LDPQIRLLPVPNFGVNSRDPNNQMYHIAWVVVEKETLESWY
jgi:hypothetical protein